MTTLETFTRRVAEVTAAIAGQALDQTLQARLNAQYPAGGDFFREIHLACEAAMQAGWMCQQGEGARRFGRIVQPSPATHGFSIDVVDLTDIIGPHHRHPTGEIDMIMPLTSTARFDGRGEGWLVYPPNSAHRPTVSAGRALILYLLPNGEIEFTDNK
ncbi:MAG: DUF4863 family protein [Sterolibacterium sp.]